MELDLQALEGRIEGLARAMLELVVQVHDCAGLNGAVVAAGFEEHATALTLEPPVVRNQAKHMMFELARALRDSMQSRPDRWGIRQE